MVESPASLGSLSACKDFEETLSEAVDATGAAWMERHESSSKFIIRLVGGRWHQHTVSRSRGGEGGLILSVSRTIGVGSIMH